MQPVKGDTQRGWRHRTPEPGNSCVNYYRRGGRMNWLPAGNGPGEGSPTVGSATVGSATVQPASSTTNIQSSSNSGSGWTWLATIGFALLALMVWVGAEFSPPTYAVTENT